MSAGSSGVEETQALSSAGVLVADRLLKTERTGREEAAHGTARRATEDLTPEQMC